MSSALTPNPVKQKLRQGECVYGTMAVLCRVPALASLWAAAGFDFMIIDTEHSSFNTETMTDMCLAAQLSDLVPLVRVTESTYELMNRTLDLGARGLICPRVDTADQLANIVDATKYPPTGQRGISQSFVHTRFQAAPLEQYVAWANNETLTVFQVESTTALENLEELCATPGADAIMMGPNDLSLSMGIPGQLRDARMMDAYQQVIAVGERHGVAPGAHLRDPQLLTELKQMGMRFLVVSTDAAMIMQSAKQLLSALKEEGT